ncbi:LADA_0B08504g1_1 [Lachancea dasiensis]|uniref:LADA_0B08504g1_1 n=1 Tax=Lachancea dasiensis TaxID=1072105 RepID=A0A1G4IUH8_9SACH|nr:LADA_0B08504g1_1 [Lachancea dasiensis]
MAQSPEYTHCVECLRKLESQLLLDPFSPGSAALISEYASMVRLMVVCVTQLNRGLQLAWQRGSDIKITRERGLTLSADTTSQVAEIIKAVDFISTLQRRFKAAQGQKHAEFRAHLKEMQSEGCENYRKKVAEMAGSNTTTRKGDDSGRATAQPESKKHQLLSTNKKITSSLTRTNHMLRSSVLRSELNVSELQEQTASLHKLNDRFDSLSGVLTASSQIVRVIQDASGRERRQIYSGLAFLGLCISWVLWRRVFKMPVKLLLWVWFRFFRSILSFFGAVPTATVGMGLESTAKITDVLATATDSPTAASHVLTQPTESMLTIVEDAVDEAFSRIRDEL